MALERPGDAATPLSPAGAAYGKAENQGRRGGYRGLSGGAEEQR
jgi:hypothetical protein